MLILAETGNTFDKIVYKIICTLYNNHKKKLLKLILILMTKTLNLMKIEHLHNILS